MPDLLHILLNGAVGGKPAAVCHIKEAHLCPAFSVSVGFVYPLLGLDIGAEICQDEVAVGAVAVTVTGEEGVVDVFEQVPVLTEGSVHQLGQDLADLAVIVEDRHGIVTAVLLIGCDFVRCQAEDEFILRPCFLNDLHIGTVHGSDEGASVHHHLLTAGSRCLETRTGNLFGQIGSGKDHFSIGHAVVFNENDFDLPLDGRVVIDHVRHGIDQLDGQFRYIVCLGCLSSDDKGPGKEVSVFRMLPDPVIAVDDVEDKENRTFVLVYPLHLHIIDGVRVNLQTVFVQNIFCQTNLVEVFDLHKLLQGLFIIRVNSHSFDPGEIRYPGWADIAGDPPGQNPVSFQKKAAVSHTVGLIIELVRHDLIEVAEEPGLEDRRMKLGNTVHGEGGNKAEIGHPDLVVMDDPHPVRPVEITGEHHIDVSDEAPVDLHDDLVDTRQQTGEDMGRPPLECFCEDSVVSHS